MLILDYPSICRALSLLSELRFPHFNLTNLATVARANAYMRGSMLLATKL
jgi:hypothetical protein